MPQDVTKSAALNNLAMPFKAPAGMCGGIHNADAEPVAVNHDVLAIFGTDWFGDLRLVGHLVGECPKSTAPCHRAF